MQHSTIHTYGTAPEKGGRGPSRSQYYRTWYPSSEQWLGHTVPLLPPATAGVTYTWPENETKWRTFGLRGPRMERAVWVRHAARVRSPLASTRRRCGACSVWSRSARCQSNSRWRRSAPRCAAGCRARGGAAAPGPARPREPPAPGAPCSRCSPDSRAPRTEAPCYTALRLIDSSLRGRWRIVMRQLIVASGRRKSVMRGAVRRRRVPKSQWAAGVRLAAEHMIGAVRGQGGAREARTQVSPIRRSNNNT